MPMNAKMDALPAGEGERVSFLNSVITVKVEAREGGPPYTVLELMIRPGAAPLPHIHLHEDECFYVLEGTMLFRCGDTAQTLEPGGFVRLPRGVVHSCEVRGDVPARVLVLCAERGFASFAAALGRPVGDRAATDTEGLDPAVLTEVAAKHGIELCR